MQIDENRHCFFVESQKDVKTNEFKIDYEIPIYQLDAKVNKHS